MFLSQLDLGLLCVAAALWVVLKFVEKGNQSFIINKFLYQSEELDKSHKPAVQVLETREGTIVLALHACKDGDVAGFGHQKWCSLAEVIQRLERTIGRKINKVLCCYPKIVRKKNQSLVNVEFFFPNYADCLTATDDWVENGLINVKQA